jgi:hypothetical protein
MIEDLRKLVTSSINSNYLVIDTIGCNNYKLSWVLLDNSGDCSPEGSTTLSDGSEYFDDINNLDDIIDSIRDSNYNADPRFTRLYFDLYELIDGIYTFVKDIE